MGASTTGNKWADMVMKSQSKKRENESKKRRREDRFRREKMAP